MLTSSYAMQLLKYKKKHGRHDIVEILSPKTHKRFKRHLQNDWLWSLNTCSFGNGTWPRLVFLVYCYIFVKDNGVSALR